MDTLECTAMDSEYEKAKEAADKLVAKLGKGWSPVVWETVDYEEQEWHYQARKEFVRVTECKDIYTCYFNTPQKQFIKSSDNPKEAVHKCVIAAKQYIKSLATNIKLFTDT